MRRDIFYNNSICTDYYIITYCDSSYHLCTSLYSYIITNARAVSLITKANGYLC